MKCSNQGHFVVSDLVGDTVIEAPFEIEIKKKLNLLDVEIIFFKSGRVLLLENLTFGGGLFTLFDSIQEFEEEELGEPYPRIKKKERSND